jgi:hypothetical protein
MIKTAITLIDSRGRTVTFSKGVTEGRIVMYAYEGARAFVDTEALRLQAWLNNEVYVHGRSDRFVDTVAELILDGEENDEGDEHSWENDDAWATLHQLITTARGIRSGVDG